MRQVTVIDESFESPAGFDLDAYLAGAFAVVRGDGPDPQTVRLWFTGEAARFLRDRRRHSSQVIERSSDEELVIAFRLSDLREVARWALSWGGQCEVLEPRELRELVRAELERAVETYRPHTEARAARAGSRKRLTRGRDHAPD